MHTESRYVIDSFPVAVCHNTRIPRCKLLKNKAYHGRCASKRSWFYGFKVQVVATTDGIPVDYYIHAGSEADRTGLRSLSPDLPEGSVLYTDAGYTDYAGEDLFEEATGNRQQTARKKTAPAPMSRTKPFCCCTFASPSKLVSVNSRPVFPSRFTPSRPPVLCSNLCFSSSSTL